MNKVCYICHKIKEVKLQYDNGNCVCWDCYKVIKTITKETIESSRLRMDS